MKEKALCFTSFCAVIVSFYAMKWAILHDKVIAFIFQTNRDNLQSGWEASFKKCLLLMDYACFGEENFGK